MQPEFVAPDFVRNSTVNEVHQRMICRVASHMILPDLQLWSWMNLSIIIW